MVAQWVFACLAMVLMEWKSPKSLKLASGEFRGCVMKTQDQPPPLQLASNLTFRGVRAGVILLHPALGSS